MGLTKLDNGINAGCSLKGEDYRFCTWGARTPLPSVAAMRSGGLCCTEFLDHVRRGGGEGQVGGTPAWEEFLEGNFEYVEEFDGRRWYCVGGVPLQFWRGGKSEGHISIISRPNQLSLEAAFGLGVAEVRTPAGYAYQGGYDIVGTMPDFPGAEGLPWKTPFGRISVGGYPGHCASPRATAFHFGRVAAWVYGLPAVLPVMTSYVELTQGWQGPGCVTEVPGYATKVDHTSLGWFQQQDWWGTAAQRTNAEYALAKFLDAALGEAPEWPAKGPYTADQLGRWAQRVQRSALPNAYRDKGFPAAVRLMKGTALEGHKLAV